MSRRVTYFNSSFVSFDPDALEFIENWEASTLLTMSTPQRLATQDFYKGLKGQGTTYESILLNKLITAGTRMFIMIPESDILATSNAYKLDAISNGVNQSTYFNFLGGDILPTGVIGGLNKYVDLGVSPTSYNQNDVGLAHYSRTNSAGTFIELGASNSSAINGHYLATRLIGNSSALRVNDSTSFGTTVPDSTGLFLGQRNATIKTFYRNGGLLGSISTASTGRSTQNLYAHARNINGTADVFSTRELCFYAVGMPALTSDEISDLYTIVQRLQSNVITGGRQIGTVIAPI